MGVGVGVLLTTSACLGQPPTAVPGLGAPASAWKPARCLPQRRRSSPECQLSISLPGSPRVAAVCPPLGTPPAPCIVLRNTFPLPTYCDVFSLTSLPSHLEISSDSARFVHGPFPCGYTTGTW